jgi:outer membrane murein-binding lipoprotein Lpp
MEMKSSFRASQLLLFTGVCAAVILGHATHSRSSEDVESLRSQIEKLKLENERLKLELKKAKIEAIHANASSRVDSASEAFLDAPTPGMTWDEFIERHRKIQGENTPGRLQEKYRQLAGAYPGEPAYAYLAARASLDYERAQKCTEVFPQFVWCYRLLATDDAHYDRALRAAKTWARLAPTSSSPW